MSKKFKDAENEYLKDRCEIRLTGLGGQGLLLSGLILAEACALIENKYTVQTQQYAPLARGAPSKSEIIISRHPVDYPHVIRADFQVILSQDSFIKYRDNVKGKGIIIIDTFNVKANELPENIIPLPLTQISIEATGKPIAVSIAALGAMTVFTDIVNFESIKKTLINYVPRGTEEINTKAMESGRKIGEEYRLKKDIYLKTGLN